ncbi:MAG: hypothetical protein RMM10_07520 [Anaerolineae bacterium]|uniref:hypothetical protein n=1 Tax=Thermoflexus sp. TaxID=1969742 RepID=UPI0025D86F71|nr:hypothetical protein [Thermoflexus sp.]MCS7351357.1 hypothetical protein [Thermoflexus sp.]MDW8180812.1 hypothetical protein [Anaerolineae bacterium]
MGGTISPQSLIGITGEVFASHSEESGEFNAQVVGIGKGLALGLSFPPQGEAHVYIAESRFLEGISKQDYLNAWTAFWQEIFKEALQFPIIPGP